MVKKSGSYRPNSRRRSASSSPLSSSSTLTFNSPFFGEQSIHFLDNPYFGAFIGGLIFGLVQVISLFRDSSGNNVSLDFSVYLTIILISGLGFVFLYFIRNQVTKRHEMSTEFGIWPVGTIITFLTTLFGLIFYLFGFFHDKGGDGRSRANVGIYATISSFSLWAVSRFILPEILYTEFGLSYFEFIAILGFVLQSFLIWGIINLIPFGLLDGKKILDYNTGYYILIIVMAFICYFFQVASDTSYGLLIIYANSV